MSTMTKFLKQTCQFCAATRSGGTTVLTEHGDIVYESPVELKCRRELCSRDMQTANGAIVKVSSRYFLDDSVQVQVDDTLDGHVILTCSEYVDQFGVCVGYEAYV